jgi:hypothetical protein
MHAPQKDFLRDVFCFISSYGNHFFSFRKFSSTFSVALLDRRRPGAVEGGFFGLGQNGPAGAGSQFLA